MYVHFNGACPRCVHAMEFRYPLIVVEGVDLTSSDQLEQLADNLDNVGVQVPAEGETDVDIYCTCREQHEKDKDGCGAYGVVHVSWG